MGAPQRRHPRPCERDAVHLRARRSPHQRSLAAANDPQDHLAVRQRSSPPGCNAQQQARIEDSKSNLSLDFVKNVVAGPQVRWTMVPENTMKFATFMASTEVIKVAPSSWQDDFFPEVHGLGGS